MFFDFGFDLLSSSGPEFFFSWSSPAHSSLAGSHVNCYQDSGMFHLLSAKLSGKVVIRVFIDLVSNLWFPFFQTSKSIPLLHDVWPTPKSSSTINFPSPCMAKYPSLVFRLPSLISFLSHLGGCDVLIHLHPNSVLGVVIRTSCLPLPHINIIASSPSHPRPLSSSTREPSPGVCWSCSHFQAIIYQIFSLAALVIIVLCLPPAPPVPVVTFMTRSGISSSFIKSRSTVHLCGIFFHEDDSPRPSGSTKDKHPCVVNF